jgi:hypothetical protein
MTLPSVPVPTADGQQLVKVRWDPQGGRNIVGERKPRLARADKRK